MVKDKPDFDKPRHLGHVLWEMRESFGMERSELAPLIGATERTLYNIETGKTDLTLQKFDRIVNAMRRELRGPNGMLFEEKYSPRRIAKRVYTVVRGFMGGVR